MSEATARRFFARRLRAQMRSGAVLQGMTREERRAVFSAVIYFLGFSSPSLESLAGGLRDRGFVLGDGETLMRFTVVPVGAPAVGVFSNPRIASAVQSLWRRRCFEYCTAGTFKLLDNAWAAEASTTAVCKIEFRLAFINCVQP